MIQPRWPRTRPPLTWKIWTAASSSSSATAIRSASVASASTTALFSIAFLRASMSSRRRAARSYSISSAADAICFSSRRRYVPVRPVMKSQNSSASSRCSSAETFSTHGAEHFPMYPSRHGRPVRAAFLNTPAEHVRTGNTLSSRSTVSRIAHACPYGPKYRTPFFFWPRITWTRGYSSFIVTARYG
ncbi:hypothetical protein a10_06311 [Streptomyces acidiscabies]|nr:hypothetical protein a10_06311 [Streptomyces acidiscabies]